MAKVEKVGVNVWISYGPFTGEVLDEPEWIELDKELLDHLRQHSRGKFLTLRKLEREAIKFARETLCGVSYVTLYPTLDNGATYGVFGDYCESDDDIADKVGLEDSYTTEEFEELFLN